MILLPIVWFVVFFGGWGLLFLVVHFIGKALQWLPWPVQVKRIIYVASATLLVTPLLPWPVPSATLLVAFFLGSISLISKQMLHLVPSFAITMVICWLIARRKFLDKDR